MTAPNFDIGRFVESCFERLAADRPLEAIRELLTVTVSKPRDLIAHDRTLWHPDTLQPMPFDNDKYFGLVREAKAVQVGFQHASESGDGQ